MQKFALLMTLIAAPMALATGCAPQLQGAQKVGGPESSTWIFLNVDDKGLQGVYRCAETNEKGPVCIKAKLER